MPWLAVALLSPRLAQNGLAGQKAEALVRMTANLADVNSALILSRRSKSQAYREQHEEVGTTALRVLRTKRAQGSHTSNS